MSGIQNLRVLYEDMFGTVLGHWMDDGKVVLHCQFNVTPSPDILQHAKVVSKAIDEALKERGIEKLYAWGVTDEQERFNYFLGFEPSGLEVVFEGYTGPAIFEYVKDL